jgi:hypothetical protein
LVFIYQMPKVGSQTVEATLRQEGWPYPVFRFHYLSETIAIPVREALQSDRISEAWKRDASKQLQMMQDLTRLIRWRQRLRGCGFPIPPIDVITGVRELIGLQLSSIFENYAYFAPNLEALTVEVCQNAIQHPNTLKQLQEWFDTELNPFLGLDVFSRPFPRERGYTVVESKLARALVYRFENLDIVPAALQEFLGLKIPALANRNLGENKIYREQYRKAKAELHLPADFVNSQYSSRLMRHFYSDQERERFARLWRAPGNGHASALAGQEVELARAAG